MIEILTKILADISASITNIPAKEAIIFDIALILIISAIFAFIARMLKQPLIPAYVLAGVLIGPLILGLVKNIELMYAFAEIGIAFLLFTAGLQITFKRIKEANIKKILLIGILQVSIVFSIGLLITRFLNLTTMQAIYVSIIVAFSSTMVIVKLLSDKCELVTLHGRLILGILILQDLCAIMAIAILTSSQFSIMPIVSAIIKIAILITIAFILQKFILNRTFRYASYSQELLLLSGLAVLFLFVMLAYLTNLTIVIGAYIAGVLLANTEFKFELESKISPLRDFFAILFFVALGMQLVFTGISQRIGLFLLLILSPLIIKPIVVVFLLRLTGYKPKTSFLTGISLVQLSEFSLIIGMLGLSAGVLDLPIFSAVVFAAIITMSLTPYVIEYKNQAYQFLFRRPMRIFKFLPIKEKLEYEDKNKKEVLLVGAHRMGSILLEELLKKKGTKKILVMDFNPEVIKPLMDKKIPCVYADLGSPEVLDNISAENFNLVISTVPDYEDNMELLRKIKKKIPGARIIVTGKRISEALDLYNEGADYVILPKVMAGEDVLKIISDGKRDITKIKKEHLKQLQKIHNILY